MLRRLFVLFVAPVVLATGLMAARPAAATVFTAQTVGDLWITPGLDTTTLPQSWTGSLTMVVEGELLGVFTCSLSGSGSGSIFQGSYSGTMYCSGGLGPQRAFGWFSAVFTVLYVGLVHAVSGAVIAATGGAAAPLVGVLEAAAIAATPWVTEKVAGWLGVAG